MVKNEQEVLEMFGKGFDCSQIVLSNVSEKLVNTYDSVHDIVKNKNSSTATETNEKIIITFLENKVISVENLETLINKNKITVNNKNILDNYR